MEDIILLDSTVLVDFFRRKNKTNSLFYKLSSRYQHFAVSTITRFEIFVGNSESQNQFWCDFYKNIKIIPFDDVCAFEASKIAKYLKKENKMIGIADILIAATAIANKLPISTLNLNHFRRINNLSIIDNCL